MKSRNKNLILIILLVIILGIAAGYAALNQVLTVDGTANITGDWNLKILSVSKSAGSGVSDTSTVTNSYGTDGTVGATFVVGLEYPGATATYDVVVKNKGSIPAKLVSIEGIDTANAAAPTQVTFSTDAAVNDTLAADAEVTYHVTVSFDGNTTTMPDVLTKILNLRLTYEQNT